MFKAYAKYWKKFKQYDGYSSRSDYWWVYLVNAIIIVILTIIRSFAMIPQTAAVLNQARYLPQSELQTRITNVVAHPTGAAFALLMLSTLFGLVILVPNVMVMARRLRDAGFPAWFALVGGLGALYGLVQTLVSNPLMNQIGMIFNVIAIILIVLCIFPSKYGEDEADDSRNYD